MQKSFGLRIKNLRIKSSRLPTQKLIMADDLHNLYPNGLRKPNSKTHHGTYRNLSGRLLKYIPQDSAVKMKELRLKYFAEYFFSIIIGFSENILRQHFLYLTKHHITFIDMLLYLYHRLF